MCFAHRSAERRGTLSSPLSLPRPVCALDTRQVNVSVDLHTSQPRQNEHENDNDSARPRPGPTHTHTHHVIAVSATRISSASSALLASRGSVPLPNRFARVYVFRNENGIHICTYFDVCRFLCAYLCREDGRRKRTGGCKSFRNELNLIETHETRHR